MRPKLYSSVEECAKEKGLDLLKDQFAKITGPLLPLELLSGIIYYLIRQDRHDRNHYLQNEFYYDLPVPKEDLLEAKYFLEYATAVYGFKIEHMSDLLSPVRTKSHQTNSFRFYPILKKWKAPLQKW